MSSGALVAVDRGDRSMAARLQIAAQHGFELRANAMVIAQVWRDSAGARRGWHSYCEPSTCAR
jgi:hypothetical protein